MKPRFFLLLKFLLCLVLLYSLREWVALAYRAVLQLIGTILLTIDAKGFDCNQVCSLRIVVFLSLVLVTPQAKLKQRFIVILVGLAVFVGIDLAGLFLWPHAHPLQQIEGETFFQLTFSIVWSLLRDLLFPILLWLVAFDRHLWLMFPAANKTYELEPRRSFFGG